jgi:hypothetical protein
MSDLLVIFAPYMTFISFFISATFNLYLVSKNINWFVILFSNILLSVIMNFLGLGQFDIITQAVKSIGNYITDLFSSLLSALKFW